MRLSQLTDRIAEAISGAFSYHTYWVIADVSNHSFYPNKDHHYFELVEKEESGGALLAKAPAAAWKAGAARIKDFEATTGQRFKNGIRVCVKVHVEYHSVYGLKLVVQDIDPSYTIGQLELQRLATITRLLNECAPHVQRVGDRFQTRNNSLTHSAVIQRIAVLSSSASAGYQDFMHTLTHNQFGYRFRVNSYFTTIQGEAYAEAASHKIQEICQAAGDFDAVVIIRGGGADADFLIFDQFVLCASVAQLPIPVITGIGHLKNETLVDLMAHTPTKTPTKAAEFIVAHNRSFEQSVLTEQQRIVIKSQQILARHIQAILSQNALIARKGKAIITSKREAQEKIKEKVVLQSKQLLHQQTLQLTEVTNRVLNKPQLYVSNKRRDVENLASNLKLQANHLLNNQKRVVSHYESMCRMMSPINILKKGFALVYHNDKIMTQGNTLVEGDTIKVRLSDSEVEAAIQNKKQNDGDPFNV